MDGRNHVKCDRFQRIQCAKLLINSKWYPLYKGLNLIGRNKSATVNIKNVNVSQNQAVIVLVDENQHFLSDSNSSNGTFLHNTQLTPFKLYELCDNAEIKFGNVSATYNKINFDSNTSIYLHETMELTQNITQTFYGANTQLLDTINESSERNCFNRSDENVEDLHDKVTQQMEYPEQIPLRNIIFKKPDKNKVVRKENLKEHKSIQDNIPDAPTQLVKITEAVDQNTDNSTQIEEENCIVEIIDTNLHDAPTQIMVFPAKLQKDTTREEVNSRTTLHWSQEPSTSRADRTFDDSFSPGFKNTNVNHEIIDDTITESIDNTNSDDSLDFLAMQLLEKEANKENVKVNSSRDSSQDKIVDKSDDVAELKKTVISKKHDDFGSDSDTDIDEPNVKSVKQHQETDPGSDTDIDEPVIKSNKTLNDSQNSEIVRPKRRALQLSSQSSETNSETESCKARQILKETENSDSEIDEPVIKTIRRLKEDKYSRSSQDSDIIRPKRKSVPKLEDTQNENFVDVVEQVDIVAGDGKVNESKLNDSDVIPATQMEPSQLFSAKDGTSSEEFKLGITELMDDLSSQTQKEEKSNNNLQLSETVTSQKDDKVEDNICMMLTQKINTNKDFVASTSTNVSENKGSKIFTFKKKTPNLEDSLTTILGTKNNAEDAVYVADTQKINVPDSDVFKQPMNKSNTDIEDDIYLQETQCLKVNTQPISSSKVIDDDKDDVFMMSTQKIELDTQKTNDDSIFKQPINKNKSKDGDDIYLLSTQVLNPCSEKITIDEDDDEFMMPTQKINFDSQKNITDDAVFKQPISKCNTVKDKEDDIYLQPTQTINPNTKKISSLHQDEDEDDDDDDAFMMPTQKITTVTQKINKDDDSVFKQPFSKSKTSKDDEDDIYLQPTQPINSNAKKIISTVHLDEDDDDAFMMPTQKIETGMQKINNNVADKSKQPVGGKGEIIDKEDDDIYLQATQAVSYKEKVIDEMEFNDPKKLANMYDRSYRLIVTEHYETETEQELQCFDEQIDENSGNRPENPIALVLTTTKDSVDNIEPIENVCKDDFQVPESPVSRRSKKASKVDEAVEDRPETLSQIDTFIKETGKINITKNIFNQPKSKNKMETKKNDDEDHPETLSQIEAFIKQPAAESTSLKIKKAPSMLVESYETYESNINRRLSKRRMSNQDIEKPSASTTILKDIPEDVESDDFQPSPNKVRKMTVKKSENEDDEQLNSSKEDKCDVNKSLISLLDSKVKKVKKTRSSNLGQIQVTTTAKRRSMGIAETSILESTDIPASKTRKSVRASITNTRKASVKPQMASTTSGSEVSDVEIPAKIAKKSNKTELKKEETVTTNDDVKPAGKRVSRRNSASSTSSDVKTMNVRNKRKTRGVVEDTTDTSEERAEPPSKKNLKGKNKDEEILDNDDNKMKSVRGRRQAKETAATSDQKSSKLSSTSSSEDVSIKNEEVKQPEPATPSRNKRVSKVKKNEDVAGESSTSTSNFSTPKRGQRNVPDEALLNSAERAKRKLKPKIVFTMFENPQLESAIKRMGGSVVDSVDSCTVLVTEHVKRTQKLLTAVGQGKPVCSPAWLNACKKANEFLDPWDYILLDKDAEKKWEFSLKESILKASKEKLLQQYTFQIMVTNAVEVLKSAIEACGGRCVTRNPGKNTEGNFIIIASQEQKTKYQKIVKQNPDVKVVEPEAIFDGVLRQELRLSRHLLT